MISIWQKYLVKEIIKTFCLFIFVFYGLYVLIDYSVHANHFHLKGAGFQWKEIFLYYLLEFIKRGEVFFPFALLLATIKVLSQLNTRNEHIALLVGGIKIKTLLRPFLAIAILLISFMYINEQFFLPQALKKLKSIEETKKRQTKKLFKETAVHHLVLKDGSRMFFQDYESDKQRFFDVYWVKNIDEIYRIAYLYPSQYPPLAEEVEYLSRNDEGSISLVEKHQSQLLPGIVFNKKELLETITPADELSLIELAKKVSSFWTVKNEKEARFLANFYYKLFMPWLCLFAVIGPAPYCLRFTRLFPSFFIYAGSISALVATYLLMDSALIFATRNIIAPLLALGIPFFSIFALFSTKYSFLR